MEKSGSSNEGVRMSPTRDRTASRPAHSPAAEEPAPPTSPASAPRRTARPTRAEWARIAIFGIPCGALYPTQLLRTLAPVGSEHFLLIQDCVNIGLLVLALAIAGRVFLSDFSYLRTRPIRKVAALLGLFVLTMIAQNLANNALSTPSSFGDGSLHYFTEGFGGLVFSFIVALGGPLIEEVFFRHFLIGTLSAYAPTWLVATVSCLLFTLMHCHGWQDIPSYIPLALTLTLAYLCSGKNLAYAWLLHALNNSLVVGAVFLSHVGA